MEHLEPGGEELGPRRFETLDRAQRGGSGKTTARGVGKHVQLELTNAELRQLRAQRPVRVFECPAPRSQGREDGRRRGDVVAVVCPEHLDLVETDAIIDVRGRNRRAVGGGGRAVACALGTRRDHHTRAEHCDERTELHRSGMIAEHVTPS